MKQASCKSLCVSFKGQLDAEEQQPSPDRAVQYPPGPVAVTPSPPRRNP